jgi:hypothetical protein
MKTTNKMDGDIFARKLANEVRKPNNIIIASDATDIKDEATQAAEAYWMMGWTWDEIESVLEDSEYPKNVINHALKETKEYAKKVLNEGPFRILNVGQTVKLINGSIGVLEEKFADTISVNIKDIGNVQVKADQLNLVATDQLREAFILRKKAANMLYKLSTDELEHISMESQTETESNNVDIALATMLGIKQTADDIMRDAAQIQGKWETDTNRWQPESQEEKEFAQYLQITLTGENQLDSAVRNLFYVALFNSIASLDNVVKQGTDVPENIDNFLTKELPSIANVIEGHLYGIKKRNITAQEYVQQFAKFGKYDANWKHTAVSWAAASWENTKEFTNIWETKLDPQIRNGIDLISAFLGNVKKQQEIEAVKAAMRVN